MLYNRMSHFNFFQYFYFNNLNSRKSKNVQPCLLEKINWIPGNVHWEDQLKTSFRKTTGVNPLASQLISFDGSLGPITYGEHEGENITSAIASQYSGFVQDGVCGGSETVRVLP